MPREENTADNFPDKHEFIPPAKIRRKPDCDRKTLIPDPCDLRIDRRKKTLENNDCETDEIVQVCPEDLGKFKIPELPIVPDVFIPKNVEAIVVPRIPGPPPAEQFCNKSLTVNCPSDGWLDADWARDNINTAVDIQSDAFGGVTNIDELGIDESSLPNDPKIFIPKEPDNKKFGGSVTLPECVFVASTQYEANKRAKIHALEKLYCEYCSPEVKVDCSDLQALALPIGGKGYSLENTEFIITGDGNGAKLSPVIDEDGRITKIEVDSPGQDYRSINIEIVGDGEGAAIGRVILDEEDCGSGIVEVELGQTLPDPAYDPELDPPIVSRSGGVVCIPPCTYTSAESEEDARDQAFAAALASLDCSYQSKKIHKDCPEPQVPKSGFDMPLGAFKTRISRGTQIGVNKQAQDIIDALSCISVVCPDGFPEAIVDIEILDPNEKCEDDGSGGNGSYFDASFDEQNCAYKLEGVLELPEIPCPCGFTTTTSVSQGGGGDECDAPNWSATTPYEADSQVVYDGGLYESGRWSRGDVPSSSSAWSYRGKCGDPEDPEDPEDEANSTCSIDLGVIVSGGDVDFNFDMETCSFDLDLTLPSVALTCETIDFDVSGGNFTASITGGEEPGVTVTVTPEEAECEGSGCGLGLQIPDVDLEIVIPCPEGITANGTISVSGGSITAGEGVQIESNSNCGNTEISISVEDCEISLEGEICLPDVEISVNIPCSNGITASGGIGVEGTGMATVTGGIEAEFENCAFELSGNLLIDVPEIECANGFTASSDITFTGTGMATTSGGISAEVDNCNIELTGDIAIDVPVVTCGNGYTTSSDFTVTGTGMADASGSISLGIQDCGIELTGDISIDVPEIDIPCANGFSAEGNVTVTGTGMANAGGSISTTFENCCITTEGEITIDVPQVECANGISASSDITVTGTGMANASGNISATFENCALELTGGISIDVPEIDIECANGFSASSDITVTGTGMANASGNIGATFENCELELTGDISIDVPDIECANGFTASSDITVTGTGMANASGNIGATFENCELELTGDISIDVPDIECANGFSVGSDITVTGTGMADASGNINATFENCELELTGDISIDVPQVECANGFSAEGNVTVTGTGMANASGSISTTFENCCITTEGDITIDVPQVECANGFSASSDITVTGTGMADASGDITATFENCALELSGDISIDVPQVECANGFSADGYVTVTGTGMATASGSISTTYENCCITTEGDITIDVPDIECANGFSASSDITVTGTGMADASGSISATFENCALELSGDITIDVPDIECANGMSASGSAEITTSGIATGGGNISITMNGCNLELTGSVDINVEPPDCANIDGAVCDSDIGTTTLSVCDDTGTVTSITVLTYN